MRWLRGTATFHCPNCGSIAKYPVYAFPVSGAANLWTLTFTCDACGTQAKLRGRLLVALSILVASAVLVSFALFGPYVQFWMQYPLSTLLVATITCWLVLWLVFRVATQTFVHWKALRK
jgi:predicted RNA-binding Zn-ribbon protein involved in translation (DUF1610 family)